MYRDLQERYLTDFDDKHNPDYEYVDTDHEDLWTSTHIITNSYKCSPAHTKKKADHFYGPFTSYALFFISHLFISSIFDLISTILLNLLRITFIFATSVTLILFYIICEYRSKFGVRACVYSRLLLDRMRMRNARKWRAKQLKSKQHEY